MKTACAIGGLLLLVFVFVNAGCGGGENVDTGEGFPVIPGDQFDIGDYQGKVVIVDFFGTHCKGCEDEVDSLAKITEEYRDEDVAVVGVCLDSNARKSIPPYALEHNINYPIFDGSNGTLKSKYGIIGIPTTLFFDKDGEEAARILGAMSQEEIAAEIDGLLYD